MRCMNWKWKTPLRVEKGEEFVSDKKHKGFFNRAANLSNL